MEPDIFPDMRQNQKLPVIALKTQTFIYRNIPDLSLIPLILFPTRDQTTGA